LIKRLLHQHIEGAGELGHLQLDIETSLFRHRLDDLGGQFSPTPTVDRPAAAAV
jgi:hypothetical protein